MVRFSTAALVLTSCITFDQNVSLVVSFQSSNCRSLSGSSPPSFQHCSNHHLHHRRHSNLFSSSSLSSGSGSSSSSSSDDARMMGEALSSATNAAVDSIITNLATSTDSTSDLDEEQIRRRQQLIRSRSMMGGGQSYKVTLPLRSSSTTTTSTASISSSSQQQRRRRKLEVSSSSTSSVLDLGIRLCQVTRGRIIDEERQLDLDTLQYVTFDEDDSNKLTQQQPTAVDKDDDDEEDTVMDVMRLQRRIDGSFQGLVVSSVERGSAGWLAGVRPGDILKTTSATLGSQLWPKSTLDGVRSVMVSRKAVSRSIQFEFQRLSDLDDDTTNNQFELSLTRPIGLELRETPDGYVEVTGFTEKASNLVKYGVQIGDRVLAVDSSIGGRLWPVSTVEGVISAVTARLPGQQITFRFERTASSAAAPSSVDVESSTSTEVGMNTTRIDGTTSDVTGNTDVVRTPTKVSDFELLQKCRSILKRYTADQTYINKFEVPAVVADKVMQTLATAEAQMDPITLSMVQTAYLSSNQPQKAIDAFEAAVGLKGDGSSTVVVPTDGPFVGTDDKSASRIIPTLAALDVYTTGSLMKALKMKNDIDSVHRVLQALEGKAGVVVNGIETADWPGTGPNGTLRPDTQCYNIAISASADQSTEDGVRRAQDIFEQLANPGRKSAQIDSSNTPVAQKDVVTYNTMIKILADFAAYGNAIDIFYEMKKFGIQPDKLSYTCLAKAVMMNNDIEELLYDMKEQGVSPDVIFFNTIIKELCEQKKLAAARRIVTLMESAGVSPDSLTYGYLMKGLISTGNPSAALTLFESACADSRTVALTENVHLYTSAVTAAASIGDYTRALDLISRMKVAGVKPNLKTLTSLMGACISGGKPDLAVGVFRSIPKPDFYALGQGLIAMSEAGEGTEVLKMLAERGTMAGSLRGRRLMNVYEVLFSYAIKHDDYDLARKTLMTIMEKGDIPSKSIYMKIFESMSLSPFNGLVSKVSFPSDGVVQRGLDETDLEKFKFLVFVVDSLHARNLPCESPLYATILNYGNHLGGLPRKIAALMIAAKIHAGDFGNDRLIDDDQCETECLVGGWEDLVTAYDDVRNQLVEPSNLPRLQVRVAKKDVPRVLRAENTLSYAAILSPRRRKEV